MKKKIVDLSEWQPPAKINYQQMSAELALGIIRVQYGSNYIDKHYQTHYQELRQRGVPINVYAWVRGTSVDDMRKEARDFKRRADQLNQNLAFYWLDVEERSMVNMREGINAYVAELRKLGVKKIGAYIAHHLYADFNLDVSKFDSIWLPHYGNNNGTVNSQPDFPCDLHQYTSQGRIKGYNGDIDLNRLTGRQNLNFFTTSQGSKPPVKPEVRPPVQPLPAPEMLKVGQRVTVKKSARQWRDGESIADWVKGSSFMIQGVQNFNKSLSKLAYRIGPKLTGGTTGYILEQDLIESGVLNGFESAPVGTTTSHQVLPGETLWHIARKYGVTVADIVNQNTKLIPDRNLIYPGQKLTIQKKIGPSSGIKYHKIKRGDTLSALALTYKTSVAELKRLNGLTTDLIYAGAELRVK